MAINEIKGHFREQGIRTMVILKYSQRNDFKITNFSY